MNINHSIIEPQIATCVKKVQELVTNPAFKHTAVTTYYKTEINLHN